MLCGLIVLVAGCRDALGPDAASVETQRLRSAVADNRNAVIIWNDALLEAIRSAPMGPPMTARALAVVHTSMYDAWAAYDGVAVGTRLGSALRRPEEERTLENKREAISYAAYRASVDLWPTRAAAFSAVLQALGYDPANVSTDVTTPAGVGNTAAAAVLDFRHDDGCNQLQGYADYTGYQSANSWDIILDPARWQPLRIQDGQGGWTYQHFLAPHWYVVTPFALTSGSQFRPRPPAPYKSGEYHRQIQEVIHLSATLGDQEKAVAEYWADGPRSEQPPGHWNLLAQTVSYRDGHDLDQDVRMFFALNNALFDAGIVAWDAKRHYDYVRPITAIRYLKKGKKIRAWGGPGQGTRTIDGEAWQPYQALTFVTPPFSEYVSGHSTFSAAAAEVMKLFTGSDAFNVSHTVRAGSSLVEPGLAPARDVTLSWSTFSEAADEAGMSRLYGGIHFRDGDLEGRKAGRKVGRLVWQKAQGYFTGIATD